MSTSRDALLDLDDSGDWGGEISRESLGEKAFNEIRDALMHGKLRPGQKLALRPLSKRFGISATPMREALLKLVSKEALVLDSRGTVMVPELRTGQLEEIRNLRMTLEGQCAERAAKVATSKQIVELESTHSRLTESFKRGDLNEAIHLNTEFHLSLCAMAGLPITLDLVESLWMRCGPILSHLYDHGSPFSGTHPHEQVIAALRDGNGNAAAEAIRFDIEHGGKGLFAATTP